MQPFRTSILLVFALIALEASAKDVAAGVASEKEIQSSKSKKLAVEMRNSKIIRRHLPPTGSSYVPLSRAFRFLL